MACQVSKQPRWKKKAHAAALQLQDCDVMLASDFNQKHNRVVPSSPRVGGGTSSREA